MNEAKRKVRLVFYPLVLTISVVLIFTLSTHAQEAESSIGAQSFAPQLQMTLSWPDRGTATGVAWSPDGQMLAVSGSLGVWLYQADTFMDIGHLDGHEDIVTTIAWSPDSRMIVSGSRDRTLRVWDVSSGAAVAVFEEHRSNISSVNWSPDGAMVTSTSWDDTTQIWNPLDAHVLYMIPAPDSISGVDYAQWSTNGQFATRTQSFVCVVELDTGNCLVQMREPRSSSGTLAWSPDGRMIATGGGRGADIWDAAKGELLASFQGHEHYVHAVAWHPNNRWIASNSVDRTVKVWDVISDDLIVTLDGGLIHGDILGFAGYADSLDWSPDGNRLAAAGDDNLVRIWVNDPDHLTIPNVSSSE